MIYNKEPILVLYDMVKDLCFYANGRTKPNAIPIFKEIMNKEANDIPDSYILLRSQLSDTAQTYGDGKTLIRNADCDIILISKGYAINSNDLHNVNKRKIQEHLQSQDINFQGFNLGFEDGVGTQYTFRLEIEYIG